MQNTLTIYCIHCHERVSPIRGAAMYRCPKCLRTILPSQVADELDRSPIRPCISGPVIQAPSAPLS
jgi:predicted RNA-binding Zn-ribbon protein involved in translation (DUF1610 family)